MDSIYDTFIRAAVGFGFLLFLTRLLGKKQIGHFTFFTYITGLAMGNIAGDMVVHRDVKIYDGIAGLVFWAFFTYIVEYISIKSARARVILDGEPTIVIKKGIILEKALLSTKLNIDDLTMLLRNNNIFSVQDVEYAILEPNGQLSVMKKQELETVTKKDLQVPIDNYKYIPTEIIVDGNLVSRNLKELAISKEWVQQQIKQQGFNNIEEVFFAELQKDGSLFINKRKNA
jgi:uncharacterized membrane protein YcaP (DUF421 family)